MINPNVMINKITLNHILVFFAIIQIGHSQNQETLITAKGSWVSLIKLDNFDPNDDQQSNADTDLIGNSNYAMLETQKETITFSDGITDDSYYFRVRLGESNPSTSFYLGVDVTGDLIADLFVEANMKSKPAFVSFHLRDYSQTGLSPSQTSWLNGVKNNEATLTSRNANITSYTSGTDLDGGNSGEDYWIEFGFTENSIQAYVLDNFNISITGDSLIALYGFTSTSQTSNGDVGGVNDSISGELDKTWEELGVIINGSLNNLTSGEIITPTVNPSTTTTTSPTITGTWGGKMLGDDNLSVTVNGTIYTTGNGLIIENTIWSLTIPTELSYGIFDLIATTSRTSTSTSKTDVTSSELTINPPNKSSESAKVTSANDGGLESNGNLATLIAKRNFNRIKNNSHANKKQKQRKFSPSKTLKSKSNTEIDLASLFPNTGISGNETAYLSSATDLLGITNAKEVLSVDYYIENQRVSAALATETFDGIYDHSKIICDRLNSSSLENAWTYSLKNHEIIMIKIIRDNGLIEYALNFSIELNENKNTLHSYWNISQYPEGEFLNFQIWGNTIGQITSTANHIIHKLEEHKPLSSTKNENKIPTVYVKKGFYKDGKLHLIILNKSKESSMYFQGNLRNTELSSEEFTSENIDLYGYSEEEITIEIGNLFDIGFSVKGENSPQQDALYLADGPWGIDYLKEETNIEAFVINNESQDANEENYNIERNVTVKGEVFGTVNLFRNVLPGELIFDVSDYSKVEFTIQNSLPVEVILVTENLEDWNQRLRFELPINQNDTITNISLSDFKDANGLSTDFSKIRGLVFSVRGNYSEYQKFDLSVKNLSFRNNETLSEDEFEFVSNTKLFSYPNPANSFSTLVLPKKTESAQVLIIDTLGRVLYNKNHIVNSFNNEIKLPLNNIGKGVYRFIVTTNEREKIQTNFIVN